MCAFDGDTAKDLTTIKEIADQRVYELRYIKDIDSDIATKSSFLVKWNLIVVSTVSVIAGIARGLVR